MKPGYNEIKQKFSKLSSSRFQYDLFCLLKNYSHSDFINWEDGTLKKGFSITGWCDGTTLYTRPSSSAIGVMLLDEEEGEEFWFHVYNYE